MTIQVKIDSQMNKPTRMSQGKGIAHIIEHGYINVYSNLNSKERRQLKFNREFKQLFPDWDASYIRMVKIFTDFCERLGKKARVLDAGCGNGNYIVDECR